MHRGNLVGRLFFVNGILCIVVCQSNVGCTEHRLWLPCVVAFLRISWRVCLRPQWQWCRCQSFLLLLALFFRKMALCCRLRLPKQQQRQMALWRIFRFVSFVRCHSGPPRTRKAFGTPIRSIVLAWCSGEYARIGVLRIALFVVWCRRLVYLCNLSKFWVSVFSVFRIVNLMLVSM